MTNPKSLGDTRTQLHWAAQVLSSAADATLKKADDDSHSNLGWDSERKAITGRVGTFISLPDFSLHHRDGDSFSLAGRSLNDAMIWLGQHVGAELSPREYDMPIMPWQTAKRLHLIKATLRQLPIGSVSAKRRWPMLANLGFGRTTLTLDSSSLKCLASTVSAGDFRSVTNIFRFLTSTLTLMGLIDPMNFQSLRMDFGRTNGWARS